MRNSLAGNPDWWPHRYDPARDAVHYIAADRAVHAAATFLTDDYLPAAKEPVAVARADAVAALPATAPMHFIFHSAYCCSTLLARAFDLPGQAIGYKEPVILNDLHGWKQRGASADALVPVLKDVLALVARPFVAGETVVVKPSNLLNSFAPLILNVRPEAKALLLHAPLRVYLASIARKGMWGRLWVRDLMLKQLRDGMVQLGLQGEDYLGLTDLQVAAVGWLAQQALFAALVARPGPARVRTLNSEHLLAAPKATMAALAGFFGVPLEDAALDALVAGPVFSRHSKFGQDYEADTRKAEQADGAVLHADEIDKVMTWAEAVAKNAGIPMQLDAAIA
ncbi:MAG: hypothetical protein EP335_13180 [Alphaproteobacteria bacterium]|nr:MAG: hypothetical protein EP335_13180 [Alphaproteobacteria bacterium]